MGSGASFPFPSNLTHNNGFHDDVSPEIETKENDDDFFRKENGLHTISLYVLMYLLSVFSSTILLKAL